MRFASFSARAIAFAGFLVLGASCGARSGLFGPDGNPIALDGASADVGSERDVGTDGLPDATPCIPGQFEFELAQPQMMLVINRSGSMANYLDREERAPDGIPNRWTTLRDSLNQTLRPFQSQIQIGAKFYPEAVEDNQAALVEGCIVDSDNAVFPPALNNATPILNVFTTRAPKGGTPTADAIAVAADILGARRGVARSIVVATDGAPNCNGTLKPPCVCTSPAAGACSPGATEAGKNCLDDTRTVAKVKEIADTKKIPVYIVGIGADVSAAYRTTLDAMAVAGGRPRPQVPRYYSATSAAELTGALADIRDGVASCTYLTPSAPTDPNAIAVAVGGQSIVRDPSHTNGWDWVDQAYGQLQFFGPACAALTADAGTVTVSGVVRCE